jgi:hypothetical protein
MHRLGFGDQKLTAMHIAHAILTTFFLILLAVSAAVVLSIVVLALFDLGFGKKTTSIVKEIEDSSPEPSRQRATTPKPKLPKPKLLTAFRLSRRSQRQPGCAPESQRVRHFQ